MLVVCLRESALRKEWNQSRMYIINHIQEINNLILTVLRSELPEKYQVSSQLCNYLNTLSEKQQEKLNFHVPPWKIK
jgi:hypothetical protein